ncbi:MAG TPA: SRPBCC domain-containing protein [Saprospiraceae bacterium]|nr:SRPBCC domain-containing protein [Saprospiraceae bacterium]
MNYTIFHSLDIRSSASKVYEAITDPKHLVNWWPLKCSGVPIVGQAYNFYFSSEYDWYGMVILANESEAFHIKMMDSDEDWKPTSFGFDLVDDGVKVQVDFWHTGWQDCNRHFKVTSFCWAVLLNGLKNYVEKGEIIAFEDRA